jgi:hypothetical protein
MVVSEYNCTVFSKNFLGQVSKHSKNNIKLASQRSVKLFEQLPDAIKTIIWEPLNAETFHEIGKNKQVPEYLEDITLNMDEGPRLRSENLPDNTHMLETTMDELDLTIDETPMIDANDTYMEQLQALHDSNMLNEPDITSERVPVLYRSLIENSMSEEIQPPAREDTIHTYKPS